MRFWLLLHVIVLLSRLLDPPWQVSCLWLCMVYIKARRGHMCHIFIIQRPYFLSLQSYRFFSFLLRSPVQYTGPVRGITPRIDGTEWIGVLQYRAWTADMFFLFTSCFTNSSPCRLPSWRMIPVDDMWSSITWLTDWATCLRRVSTRGLVRAYYLLRPGLEVRTLSGILVHRYPRDGVEGCSTSVPSSDNRFWWRGDAQTSRQGPKWWGEGKRGSIPKVWLG